MAKRGRGRPKKSVCEGSAEFFKVYLPHLSSHQLLIPPDFIKGFRRTIKERVTLKNTAGKMWHVDVKETRDGVFLMNGWQSFVSYHGLKIGEFLVFQYDGCYSFIVKIFGTNGCKKKTIWSRETYVKVEEETEEETEEEIEVKQTPAKRGRPYKQDHPLRGNERTGHSRENCKDFKDAASILPKGAYFISPPCPKRKYRVWIPDELIKKHKIQLKREMILRNVNGKEWPVRVSGIMDPRYPASLGMGWLAFQNDNNVSSKDSCKFTFDSGRSSRIIYVQILRNAP